MRVRFDVASRIAAWSCRTGRLCVVAGVVIAGCSPPPPPPQAAPAPEPERAAPPPPVAPAEDPPGRVGRLSLLEGVVSFRPAASDEWGPAVPNRPVTSGDAVWTDAGGRAEVETGPAVVRLSEHTELDVVRLDDRTTQLRLPQGAVSERVVAIEGEDGGEVDAPNAAVTLRGTGEYRVDVSEDGLTTRVTVWSGQAVVTASGSSFDVNARQVATVQAGDPPTYDLTDAGGPDGFDQWSQTRDAYEDRAAQTRQYVPVDMPGAADLDQYGRWDSDPTYGPVWYPTNMPAGWAPYRTGHWVWIHPWGWTWVDDAPWGYAPYHYGRWAYVRGAWAWCPGRRAAATPAPVYAPALVVFVGGPPAGPAPAQHVTWFPLAPEEVYRPAYATSPHYVQQVNVTNVTNVTNITNVTTVTNTTNTTNVTNINYRNRSAPNALTAVPQQAFITAQPVSRALVPVTPREATMAAPVRLAAPAAPTRASLGLSAANAPGAAGSRPSAAPPPTVLARAVVSTRPAPPPPVPFSAQEHLLAANGGRPLAPSQVATVRPAAVPRADVVQVRAGAAPAVRVAKAAPPAAPAPAPAAKPTPPPAPAPGSPPVAGQAPAGVAGVKPPPPSSGPPTGQPPAGQPPAGQPPAGRPDSAPSGGVRANPRVPQPPPTPGLVPAQGPQPRPQPSKSAAPADTGKPRPLMPSPRVAAPPPSARGPVTAPASGSPDSTRAAGGRPPQRPVPQPGAAGPPPAQVGRQQPAPDSTSKGPQPRSQQGGLRPRDRRFGDSASVKPERADTTKPRD